MKFIVALVAFALALTVVLASEEQPEAINEIIFEGEGFEESSEVGGRAKRATTTCRKPLRLICATRCGNSRGKRICVMRCRCF